MAAGVGVLANLSVITPLILVWMGGVVIAGILWSRQRTVAILLASACLLALVTELVGGLLTSSLPFLYSGQSQGYTRLGIIFAIVGIIRSVLMAVAWGLVLSAVWRGVAARGEVEGERGSVG